MVVDHSAAAPYRLLDIGGVEADVVAVNAAAPGADRRSERWFSATPVSSTHSVRCRPTPTPAGRPASNSASISTGLLAGVVASVEYLAGLDEDARGSRRERLTQSMESARDYLDGLFEYLVGALRSQPLVTLIGDPPARIPVVSFVVRNVPAERVVQRLADNDVLAIGNATSRILDLIGVDEIGGAVTLGLAHYSTMAEIDHLLRTLASLG